MSSEGPSAWSEPLPDEPVVERGVHLGYPYTYITHPCACEGCRWRRAVLRLEAPYDRED